MHHAPKKARRLVWLLATIVVLAAEVSTPAQSADPARFTEASVPGGQPPSGVEKMKDDFDARVPPDAPSQALMADAIVTGDYRIDALLSGYRFPVGTVTFSFYEDSVFGGSYYGSETVSEVSETVKTNVRAIMAWYGTALNVDFVEVTETTSTVGRVRIMRSSAPAYAYAYYPSTTSTFHVAGDVHLNPAYDRLGDTNGFQHPPGQHGYTTLAHEIGHAIGLKHPHDGTPTLPAEEDTHSRTIMSYQFLGDSPGTPMVYDVMALQYLYGARPARTGDSTYVFTRAGLDQYNLSGQLFLNPSTATKQLIWDTGGYNVLDLSQMPASSSGYRLDLKPLGWLTPGNANQGTYFVMGTVVGPNVSVRKVVSSSSDDTIYANGDTNVFAGYVSGRVTGRDTIHDANGADMIDLSGFSPSQVTQTPSGSDLVLGLGSSGTITVKGYYVNDPPVISYGTVVPRVSITDVSVTGRAVRHEAGDLRDHALATGDVVGQRELCHGRWDGRCRIRLRGGERRPDLRGRRVAQDARDQHLWRHDAGRRRDLLGRAQRAERRTRDRRRPGQRHDPERRCGREPAAGGGGLRDARLGDRADHGELLVERVVRPRRLHRRVCLDLWRRHFVVAGEPRARVRDRGRVHGDAHRHRQRGVDERAVAVDRGAVSPGRERDVRRRADDDHADELLGPARAGDGENRRRERATRRRCQGVWLLVGLVHELIDADDGLAGAGGVSFVDDVEDRDADVDGAERGEDRTDLRSVTQRGDVGIGDAAITRLTATPAARDGRQAGDGGSAGSRASAGARVAIRASGSARAAILFPSMRLAIRKATADTERGARTRLSPPLKWAGGKRWQVPVLLPLWDGNRQRRLVEPFCGGLAVALGLAPGRALLNDVNPHLINFYRWLKRGLTIDIELENQQDLFYRHRVRFNELLRTRGAASREAACLFYFLNRTGFNGLCRFNGSGEFNVPFGRYNRIGYVRDFTPYRAVLKNWQFTCADFESMALKPDDFVYADPPYDVEFTQYAQGGFSWADQERTAQWLARHTGPVVLVNQATPRIRTLYESLGYTLSELDAPRRINCNGDRTPAKEIFATRNL